MNPGHMFGGVGLYTNRKPEQTVSWWQVADRRDFYKRCQSERLRMKGSAGDRWVSSGAVNVLFDSSRRRKEFNP